MPTAIRVHKHSEKPDPIRIKDGQFILFNKIGFYEYLRDKKFRRKITRVQSHHTYKPDYSNFNGDDHFDDLKAMDSYHENKRNFSDIAQNITIFPDGMIGICRPIDVMPAGIKGANKGSICIEVYGNFDKGGDKMSKAQKDSILFTNAALCHRFKITPSSDTIIYHHWWNWSGKRTNGVGGSGKSCPGTNFFGGNKVEDCEKYYIPQIKAKADLLNFI